MAHPGNRYIYSTYVVPYLQYIRCTISTDYSTYILPYLQYIRCTISTVHTLYRPPRRGQKKDTSLQAEKNLQVKGISLTYREQLNTVICEIQLTMQRWNYTPATPNPVCLFLEARAECVFTSLV